MVTEYIEIGTHEFILLNMHAMCSMRVKLTLKIDDRLRSLHQNASIR